MDGRCRGRRGQGQTGTVAGKGWAALRPILGHSDYSRTIPEAAVSSGGPEGRFASYLSRTVDPDVTQKPAYRLSTLSSVLTTTGSVAEGVMCKVTPVCVIVAALY